MRLAELDSLEDDLREEYFDFIAPTGYVPHLPELRRFIEAAEEASGGRVLTFVHRAFQLDSRWLSISARRHSRALIDRRLFIDQRGRLPGLCPSAPGSGAHAWLAGSVRFGLSGSGTQPRLRRAGKRK